MIFLDMDGTLAKFYDKKNCIEKMYEENFFISLKPYKLVEYITELSKKTKIGIISACIKSPYCKVEKYAWIKKYLPFIKFEDITLCDTGENKAEIIRNKYPDCERYILIDDYSKNIFDWEKITDKNFIAIKFINGRNNKSGNNYKLKFQQRRQLRCILSRLGEI